MSDIKMKVLTEKSKESILSEDWKAWGRLCREADDTLLPAQRYDELLQFYEAGFKLVATGDQFQSIISYDYTVYANEFAGAFAKALAQARQDAEVQAIYYEYTEDESNFFLCNTFDEDDEFWAADFGKDGVVFGPSVARYKELDLDEDDWGEPASMLKNLYINACLLVNAFRQIDQVGNIEYPFGFAEHDGTITLRMPDDF
jgi:hypothetical protein